MYLSVCVCVFASNHYTINLSTHLSMATAMFNELVFHSQSYGANIVLEAIVDPREANTTKLTRTLTSHQTHSLTFQATMGGEAWSWKWCTSLVFQNSTMCKIQASRFFDSPCFPIHLTSLNHAQPLHVGCYWNTIFASLATHGFQLWNRSAKGILGFRLTIGDVRKVSDVNFLGPLHCSRALVHLLDKSKNGVVEGTGQTSWFGVIWRLFSMFDAHSAFTSRFAQPFSRWLFGFMAAVRRKPDQTAESVDAAHLEGHIIFLKCRSTINVPLRPWFTKASKRLF